MSLIGLVIIIYQMIQYSLRLAEITSLKYLSVRGLLVTDFLRLKLFCILGFRISNIVNTTKLAFFDIL